MAKVEGIKVLAENRKARYEYFILERFEAGLVLTGTEVKSVRQSTLTLQEAYASVQDGEAWIVGMHISPYEQGNRFNKDPDRKRKLLLHKAEIRRLYSRVKLDGLTLIPLMVYLKNGLVKIEIALAKGKKLYDKRETTAKRSADREIERRLKSRGRE